ncbi:MAG: hypothetical protein IH804_09785, partial [Planctomycetes bacterium]|nr:hypothetical protein [Planctomycetota bacterium]
LAALADAGITLAEVDEAWVGYMAPQPMLGVRIMKEFGLTGLPVSRWGANRLPVANLDGSTGIEETSTLAVDMRRWSPFAFGMNVPAFGP